MMTGKKELKLAAANRVFAPFESDQRRFDRSLSKLPLLTTGPTENDQYEYTFTRLSDWQGRIRVPGPNGPRYFLVRVSEQI